MCVTGIITVLVSRACAFFCYSQNLFYFCFPFLFRVFRTCPPAIDGLWPVCDDLFTLGKFVYPSFWGGARAHVRQSWNGVRPKLTHKRYSPRLITSLTPFSAGNWAGCRRWKLQHTACEKINTRISQSTRTVELTSRVSTFTWLQMFQPVTLNSSFVPLDELFIIISKYWMMSSRGERLRWSDNEFLVKKCQLSAPKKRRETTWKKWKKTKT